MHRYNITHMHSGKVVAVILSTGPMTALDTFFNGVIRPGYRAAIR